MTQHHDTTHDRSPWQARLSPPAVEALLETATTALRHRPPQARTVRFAWRGHRFTARSTGFRVCVDDAQGLPVACRYL
jgi:hypothetical protein